MTETCPYCGKQVANTKALGSHIYYMHQANKTTWEPAQVARSKEDQARFDKLFESCAKDMGLAMPKNVEKVEQALREIPPGVSPRLDRYRNVLRCANGKRQLAEEAEKLLGSEDAS